MSTTSTVIVGRAGDALLVDPAWMPDELASLSAAFVARGLRVVGGFATHAHHDHRDTAGGASWRLAAVATAHCLTGCAIGEISVGQVMRTILPFYGALTAALFAVTYVPAFSLWLPGLMK